MPFRQWMRTGLGGLGWRPADFWSATLTEFFEAINGHNEAQGAEELDQAPSADEVAALVVKYGQSGASLTAVPLAATNRMPPPLPDVDS